MMEPDLPRPLPKLSAAILATFLALVCGPAGATTSQAMVVKSTVVVPGCKVDASSLVGAKVPENLRKNLEKIPFGSIQQPLGELTIPRDQLVKNLGSFASMFEIPRTVQFIRRGDILPGSEISSRIEALCREGASGIPREEIRLDLSHLPKHVLLPGALADWELKPMSSNRLGMRLFTVEAKCREGNVRQIVQADVWREYQGGKTTRLLRPGSRIGPADVTAETVRVKNDGPASPARLAEIVGRTIATFKSPGTMVKPSDLQCPGTNELPNTPAKGTGNTESLCVVPAKLKGGLLIKPGDKVDFLVKSGNLNLMVPAKAIQGGSTGDTIRLVNLQNNRQIVGVITPDGKVEYEKN